MKKVLSLVLVIAMVLSSFSFAFAAPKFEDVVDTDYEEAINTLVALGVINGYEDGTYKPEKIVTRAEMAKLIVEILGYGNLVSGSRSNFTDTQGHWADAWIALASGRGIVIGTGDGKFTPDRQVTYDEAITMIVRALGYTDNSNELKGMTWPTNFKVKAAELKITKDVKLVATGADRGGVAQLLYNALLVNMVTVNTDGDVNYVKNGDYNKVLLNSLAKLQETPFTVTPDHLDEDHKLYTGDIVDLAPYMYQKIRAFVTDDRDEHVVYVYENESDVLVGQFRHAKNDAGKVNVRIDGKNKLYALKDADSTPVYYNGVETELSESVMENGSATVANLHTAAATFVLNDDKEIVGIIAEQYTGAERVENEYNGKSKFEGHNIPLDDDDNVDEDKVIVRGAVNSLEDIREDDVIVLFAGAGILNTKSVEAEKLTIEVVRDTVEGKITATNSNGDFLIDGEYYSTSRYASGNVVEVGSEGIFFLDTKGAIVDFEEGSESNPVDYAVVVEVLDGYKQGTRVIVEPQIKLVNKNGDEVTYDIKSSAKIKVGSTESPLLIDGVSGQEGMKVNVLLNANNTVVKYSTNSKSEITAITVVEAVAKSLDPTTKTDTTKASFVLANNVLVFNFDGDDVELVDASKLGDEIKVLAQDKNKNGEINFLFVRGLGASDTYAFIVSDYTALNDDDVVVQKVTAYVGGEKIAYFTNGTDVVTSSAIDSYNIVKLQLDGDVIEGIEFVTEVDTKNTQLIANETEVNRVSGNRIQIGSKWYTLADNAAVYVLDDKEFDEVGSTSSVYGGAKVAAYSFDLDNINDDIIEILFIFE